MIIKKMNAQDIREVKALIDSRFPININMNALHDTLNSNEKFTFVGILNNEIIVTVGIRDNNRLCWIASKYTRRGHARVILSHILSSMPYACLKVKKNNVPALNLYKSLGFLLTSETESSYVMEYRK